MQIIQIKQNRINIYVYSGPINSYNTAGVYFPNTLNRDKTSTSTQFFSPVAVSTPTRRKNSSLPSKNLFSRVRVFARNKTRSELLSKAIVSHRTRTRRSTLQPQPHYENINLYLCSRIAKQNPFWIISYPLVIYLHRCKFIQ